MDYDVAHLSKVIVRGLTCVGFWRLNGLPQKIYIFYTILAYFLVTTTTASYIVQLIVVDDLELLLNTLYIFFTEIGCYMKMSNVLIFRRKHFFKFIASTEDFDFKPMTRSEKQYFKKEYKSFRFTLRSYLVSPAIVLVLAYLIPLIVSDYVLPFPCWIPFPWKNKDNYWYAYGAVACAMGHSCAMCVLLDLFNMFVLCYTAAIYRILIHRLEALGNSVTKDMELRELINVMMYHRKVQGMAKDCEAIVSIPIFIQIMLSAFILCFTGYQLQNMSLLDAPGPYILFLDYALVMALQIYFPCYYGNEITINSERLTNALYNSNWIGLDIKTRKMMYIYMEYLKSPVVLKAGNFFHIGLGVFTKVMNNSYSLFALLMTMKD